MEECEFTETLYSYDGDKLLLFGTEACEYDEIGNPETCHRLWLTDKDLLVTYAKPFITSVNYSRGSKFHKFGVKFSFRNEKIIRYSKHYDNIVLLYENKPMKLLYSPKFDEVLIVEDK